MSQNQHNHPLLCLDGINKEELTNVVDYIYHGEIQIHQNHLDRFLGVAQKFQLQGLLQQEKPDEQSETEIVAEDEVDLKEQFDSYKDGNSNQNFKPTGVFPVKISNDLVPKNELNQKIEENIVKMEGGHKCNLCSYKSKRIDNLKEHIETHFEVRYPCQNCDSVLKSRNSLRGHKRYCKLSA